MADPPPPPNNQLPVCTPLEQEVLDEYTLLLSNLDKVPVAVALPHSASEADFFQLSAALSSLAERPTAEVLDGLRMLERKTSLVCTLLKASVYSIVLQQQIYGGEEDGQGP